MSAYNTPGLMTADRTVQEGGHNVVYDLLGTENTFKKTYILDFYVGKGNEQIINLPYPAFVQVPVSPADGGVDESVSDISVELVKVVVNSQLESNEIEYRANAAEFASHDSGWMVEEIDQDSMGKAAYLWNRPLDNDSDPTKVWNFNGRIARKIRVKHNDDSQDKLTLKISYRAFYKDAVDSDTFRSERGPVYSRDLGQFILDKLEALDAKTEINLENMFGNTSAAEDILQEDLTGVAKENWVEAELHTFDTSVGKSLLSPAQGSFYPGTDENGTTLKLFLYHIEQGVIDDALIQSGEKLGWLFIYTLNNLTAYSVASDYSFLSHAKYYQTDANGDYVKLQVKDAGHPEPKSQSNPDGYDYQPGDVIETFRTQSGKEVYILKRIPFDPRKQLDGLINDSSAVITTQQSVVLTEDNIEDYQNYSGTFVQIEPSENGTRLLTLGEDYVFADVNQAKTEKTYTRQPVYDHIRILGNLTTDPSHRLGICYQAFGGQVQAKDVRNLRKDVTNLLNIIAKQQLLSFNGLGKHPIIKELMHRLGRMESYHHHFNRVDHVIPLRLVDVAGAGSGGSTDSSVADETDFQWYNIAQLYDTRWMNGPNAKKDIGHFRISSREQGWTYEFIVTVDLAAKGSNRMVVKTLGGTGTQCPKVDEFSAIANKELVGLRLVWNGDGATSGALLQVGIDYSKYNYSPTSQETQLADQMRDTDTITVTNKSGDTSSWELYYNPMETSRPASDYVGVYGRFKYTQVINERAQSNIAYFTPTQEYNYHGPTSELVRSGVEYFIYNESERQYNKINDLVVGTKFTDYDFPIYERTLYRTRWVRTTRSEGEIISKSNNTYVIDSTSSDRVRCTLPDGETEWGEALADSRCVIRLLERDDVGTVVWMGSAPLAYFSYGPDDYIKPLQLHLSLSTIFQKYLDVDAIHSLDFVFYDRRAGRYFTKKLSVFTDDADITNKVGGEGIFFIEDMCGMTVRLGRRLAQMSQTDVFLSGVRYYTGNAAGENLEAYDPEAEGMIGHTVPEGTTTTEYFIATDATFEAGKTYYILRDSGYQALVEGESYEEGDAIEDFGETVYQSRVVGTYFYTETDALVADTEFALGTSSYINERFDLRQVRMHL